MSVKLIGALLIISSCGFFGFATAAGYRREEVYLRQMIGALDDMQSELQYRLTPLPELCRQASNRTGGTVGKVFASITEELERQIRPDVESCIQVALSAFPELPTRVSDGFLQMGTSFGRFDMEGQLRCLESTRASCCRALDHMAENRDNRLRSYQTLGLCVGAALAILFM